MIKHFNITISGKVQGVYFRASSLVEAERYGITGYARNEPNGDVYIEAQGADEGLTHFLQWCSNGPDQAKVNRILVEESDLCEFSCFEIRK
jgi:acylphosphatase